MLWCQCEPIPGSFSSAIALLISSSLGRVNWQITWPSRWNTRVGQSLTRNERPNGLPLPSSILRWRTCGYCCKSFVNAG